MNLAVAAGSTWAMAGAAGRPLMFTIAAPLQRADLPGLYTRVCALLTDHAGETLHCDVRDARPDAVTAEALARLALAARRHGCRVRLCHASPELLEFVEFMGLTRVLPV